MATSVIATHFTKRPDVILVEYIFDVVCAIYSGNSVANFHIIESYFNMLRLLTSDEFIPGESRLKKGLSVLVSAFGEWLQLHCQVSFKEKFLTLMVDLLNGRIDDNDGRLEMDIVNHLNEFNDWQRPHYEGFVQLKKLFVKHITEMASVEFTPSEQQQRSLCTEKSKLFEELIRVIYSPSQHRKMSFEDDYRARARHSVTCIGKHNHTIQMYSQLRYRTMIGDMRRYTDAISKKMTSMEIVQWNQLNESLVRAILEEMCVIYTPGFEQQDQLHKEMKRLIVERFPAWAQSCAGREPNSGVLSVPNGRLFEKCQLLGKGAYGVVYKACDPGDQTAYAFKKIIVPRDHIYYKVDDIFREVKLLASLRHDNISGYVDAWIEYFDNHTIRREIPDDRDGDRSLKYQHLKIPSHPYLHPDPFIPKFANSSGIPLGFFQSMILVVQMPFYDKTLRYWLDNRSSQHESICCVKNLEIFTKIAHGVDYLHANGIIHFDIKPENIFVNENCDQVVIADFGLAKLCNDRAAVCHSKSGTFLYNAPEQEGRKDCTKNTDMYSVGIVLLELFCWGDSLGQLLGFKYDRVMPASVEEWPLLVELISELTSPDINGRPSARQVIERLQEFNLNNLATVQNIESDFPGLS